MTIEERLEEEFLKDFNAIENGTNLAGQQLERRLKAFIKKEQEDLVREMVGEEANTTKRCEPKDRRDCEIADGAYNYKRQQIIDIAKSKGITI